MDRKHDVTQIIKEDQAMAASAPDVRPPPRQDMTMQNTIGSDGALNTTNTNKSKRPSAPVSAEDMVKSASTIGSDGSHSSHPPKFHNWHPNRQTSINSEDVEMMDSEESKQALRKHKKAQLKASRRRRLSSQCAAFDETDFNNRQKKTVKKSKWPFGAKSKVDHSPHDMFVELDELTLCEDGHMRWVEKCRWIKYEEDVEEAAERWGKPHVASLSFRSLVDLRKSIKRGAVILDLTDEEPADIGQSIVDQLVYIDQLEPEDKKAVLQCLLLKRRHVGQRRILHPGLQSPKSGRNTSIRKRLRTYTMHGDEPKREARETASMKAKSDEGALNRNFYSDDGIYRPNQHDQHVKIDVDGVQGLVDGHPAFEPTFNSGHRASIDNSYNIQSLLHTDASQQRNLVMNRILENAEAAIVLVGTVDFLKRPITAFVRLSQGRKLGSVTEVPLPVRFIFLLLGPQDKTLDYYEIGRALSALMSHMTFREAAYIAESRSDILDAILDYLDESMVLPSGDWDNNTLLPAMEKARIKAEKLKDEDSADNVAPIEDPFGNPLERTRKPFGGLVNDIRRRYPKYLSDIKDGFNLQCLAAIFFIYFTCLSPAITFGGLLTDKTHRWLGVSEMLVGVSLIGLIFGALSGQPVLIVGATGPLLVFEEALYEVCESLDIDFISFRVWIGFWVAVMTIVTVALEGSFLIRYFTRFIQEIFAMLISLILILETIKKIVIIFMEHPLVDYYPPAGDSIIDRCLDYFMNHPIVNFTKDDVRTTLDPIREEEEHHYTKDELTFQPNTALLSIILCFGTFFIAWWLKGIKTSKILGRRARQVIGDFAVPIAISLMVLLDFFVEDTYTEKLAVPDGIQPTAGYKRGWFINPFGSSLKSLHVWAYFAAIIPAFLLFILVFMETEVTSMILDQKDRKLTKGSGYHLDLLLVGCFELLCGFCGFPFVCPATLRSITHISALSVFSITHAPGEKAKLIQVREQRLTAFCVHILIGVSVLMGPLLRQIPIAVLFGVFFYMGVASTHGVQLVERFKLMFMPVKHHPNVGYVRKVRPLKMHAYTLVQIGCLVVLGVVKFTRASLSFPLLLLLLVPFRLKLLPFAFTEKELSHLDCDVEETMTKKPTPKVERNQSA